MSACVLLGRDVLCGGKLQVVFGKTLEIKGADDLNVPINEIMSIDVQDNDSGGIELNVGPTVSHDYVNELQSTICDYVNVSRPKTPETKLSMKIQLKPDHVPFHFYARRLSYSDKIEVTKILDDLTERRIIQKSTSPYASPIVLVKKKTGEIRMCVDFRELNKLTLRDNFPLPLIEDQIDALRSKKFFTRLDLRDAFHHVSMEPDSVKYTSFVTPMGQFEYLKMPFGLKNSPAMFTRFNNTVFRSLLDEGKISIYIDDILIATETIEENLTILRQVIDLLVRNLLTLRLDKCSFLQTEIIYLGYKINAKGVEPSPDNIESIVHFPIPTNFKTLHSFLGLCSFFRKFIANFSILAKPLYDLLKSGNKKTDARFMFGPQHLQCFEHLKDLISSKPILRIYSPLAETELHCDASAVGFASILMQKQDDGFFHPVFFFSRRTTPAESKYHGFELECLAIVYSLERFRIYLHGLSFKIITDCNSLKLALEKKDVNPRILRWSLVLQDYDYTLEHRKGTSIRHVDALSRCFAVMLIADNTFEKVLGIMQEKDSKITEIRDKLLKESSTFYELQDGLVYRKSGDKLLFYVPSSMVHNVIKTCHDDVGHVGLPKVIDLITRIYWFPGMTNEVKAYIRNCLKCVSYSPNSGKQQGFLHPIPKGDLPLQTLHVDRFGPLEETTQHNKYIFAIIDGFSKFIKLYACKTTNAKEVTKHLTSFFTNYSRPVRVIADRDSTFRSEAFKSFLEENGVQLILIARRTPRGNGQIERFNKTLKPMFAKLTPELNKWDRVVSEVEYALNNTTCRSTGKCPSELLFGFRQKGKITDLLREFLESLADDVRDLEEMRILAAEKLNVEQQISKRYYDKKHSKPREYVIGDYVMCSNLDVTPRVNKKLIPTFKGPYEVAKVLPNDRYLVRDIPGFQLSQIPYEGVEV